MTTNSETITANLQRKGSKLTIEDVITAQPGQQVRMYHKEARNTYAPWISATGTII
jgi:hypothetical protein